MSRTGNVWLRASVSAKEIFIAVFFWSVISTLGTSTALEDYSSDGDLVIM